MSAQYRRCIRHLSGRVLFTISDLAVFQMQFNSFTIIQLSFASNLMSLEMRRFFSKDRNMSAVILFPGIL